VKIVTPKIVGIVNVTEDSFSDGGRYLAPERALEHALQLAADGADVVELGPSASNPDAREVPSDEEIRRIEPLIAALAARGISISVDSFHPGTHRYCARRSEVAYINDIQGFPDASVYADLARANCRLVVMHSVQGRARPARAPADPRAVVAGIYRFFEQRLGEFERAGIARARVILDPGMGYFLGSNTDASLLVLREIAQLKQHFNLPAMVSVSRKSFLGAITGREAGARGSATLAAELFAATRGADYLRTHDVAALRDGLKVFAALA
jgi:dihydropteroate synthase type 2